MRSQPTRQSLGCEEGKIQCSCIDDTMDSSGILSVTADAPGIRANVIHGDNMTVTHVEIDQGSSLPTHSHPHEQIVNVIEGEFELTVDCKILKLSPGSVVVIPSNVPHSGRSHTKCRIIDVFHPVREDMKA